MNKMIGVVIVTHSALADEFLMATQQIVGAVEGIEPISIDPVRSDRRGGGKDQKGH